ncbi:MAG: hypothetical protein Kilf2KO_37680 [Rhodospirillales bacterium]
MKNAGEKQTNGIVVEAERRTPDDAATTAVTFDPRWYRQELEECDTLTEEQANELLLALWEIMKAFVHLGWGVDSIYRVLPGLTSLASEVARPELDEKNESSVNEFDGAANGGRTGEKDT